jgi:PBP1b-binding outer membrane lipoprotein LpoB
MRPILILISVMVLAGCYQKPVSSENSNPKIDSLLSIMTLEEKAGQLTL